MSRLAFCDGWHARHHRGDHHLGRARLLTMMFLILVLYTRTAGRFRSPCRGCRWPPSWSAALVDERNYRAGNGSASRLRVPFSRTRRSFYSMNRPPPWDSESEREVQKALDDLRVSRTTLVVAHRPQTIVKCGPAREGTRGRFGHHDALIANRGSYYAFLAAQFGENIRPVTKADPGASFRTPSSQQDGSSGIGL